MRSLNVMGAALLALSACATGNTGSSGEPATNTQAQPQPNAAAAPQPNVAAPGVRAGEAAQPYAGVPRTTQPIAPGVNAGGPGLDGPPADPNAPNGPTPGVRATPPEGATPPAGATKSPSERVSGDELTDACATLCKKAAACAPKEARMTEDVCAKNCAAVPGGQAMRMATERMKTCSEKPDCNAFSECMAGGRAFASPPAAPAGR
jgi:hypothetical protein